MSNDTQAPETPAPVTASDTKAIIRAIVGTGIGLGTLLLMLIGLTFQQNANINARIDDVNARIDDVNANMNVRFNDMNVRFNDMNARFNDVHARIDDLQDDIRELRALIFEAFKPDAPAD